MLLIDYGYSPDAFGKKDFGEEKELAPFLRNRLTEMERLELGPDARHLFEQDEPKYIADYVKEYSIAPLFWRVDEISVTQEESEIKGSEFPSKFEANPQQSFKRNVVTFYLPFNGDLDLIRIRWRTSTSSGWNHIARLSNNSSELGDSVRSGKIKNYAEASSKIIWHIEFDIIDFDDDADSILKQRDDFLSNLIKETDKINAEVKAYNSSIENSVRIAVKTAREKFKRQDEIFAKLGSPHKT